MSEHIECLRVTAHQYYTLILKFHLIFTGSYLPKNKFTLSLSLSRKKNPSIALLWLIYLFIFIKLTNIILLSILIDKSIIQSQVNFMTNFVCARLSPNYIQNASRKWLWMSFFFVGALFSKVLISYLLSCLNTTTTKKKRSTQTCKHAHSG